MKIEKKIKELNKWSYGIEIRKCSFEYAYGFHPFFSVWFFKLKSFPENGEMINKKHYNGFYFEFRPLSYFNITMYTRTFCFGDSYFGRIGKRIFGRKCFVISFPIKIKFNR